MNAKLIFNYFMSALYTACGIILIFLPSQRTDLPSMYQNILAFILIIYGIYRFVKTRYERH